MSLLEIDNISKYFGGLAAVKSFTLAIHPGEIIGLIGPNGAGKTTVFNLITGILTPVEGSIVFRGENITGLKPHQIAIKGIARTFQNIRLLKNLSVIDNVLVGTHLRLESGLFSAILRLPGYNSEESKLYRKAHQLLQKVGLEKYGKEKAGSLPYGEQRKLEIARALATDPQLLLLDEPAAGMNPRESRELIALIRQIRQEFDVTILLIEHDMKVVMEICEKIMVLDYGETIAAGNPESVKNDPEVIRAYLGVDVINA